MTILHLDDDPAAAERVSPLLRQQWPACRLVPVRSRSEFEAALRAGGHDLILSDIAAAGLDGLEALRIARELAPEVPFIFLSGKVGEDRAVDALRSGAQDCVAKDRPGRLVPAIERALHEAHERQRLHATEAERGQLAATLESSPDFVGLFSPDGRVLYLNGAARRMVGLGADALPAELHIDAAHPAAVRERMWRESIPTAMREGTWSGENLIAGRDGREIPVSQVIVAHRSAGGTVEYLSTIMRDVSSGKRAEAVVNAQNQILEMIAGGEPMHETLSALLRFIENQSDDLYCSILRTDDEGRRLRYIAAPRLPPEYVAATDNVRIGPDQGSCGTSAYQRAPVIATDITTDGRWSAYRELALAHGLRACWSTPIFTVSHRLLGVFAIYQRAPGAPTERHRQLTDVAVHMAAICLSRGIAERQLREQAEILNKASDAIIVTDRAGRITFWNHGAERTFTRPAGEVLGRTVREVFPALSNEEFDSARSALGGGHEWKGEVRLADRAGAAHLMQTRITPIQDDLGAAAGFLAIATDVSDRRRIEEQFFRAQRLESVGMLAAGIAHDLNNVLAPILLAAPMLRDHATDPSDLRMISTLEKSAERGAGLVRQILGFAHGAEGEHRVVQPKHLLRDVGAFIDETFPKRIQLEQSIPADLWTVKGNPTQMHQVLLNLCVNARDAMPDGGTLTLRGENLLLDDASAATIEGGLPGAFVVFHIQDTGTGIAPEVLPRIWEPFYTTKTVGKGTGLGLSTVRGIVESHGGFATVHTLVGRGTTFRIHFPAAEAGSQAGLSNPPISVAARGVGELVLVVDDEVGIRNMAAAILARHGYRVLTAADGAEAIALFAPRSREIRVVITDLSMPNLDGIALAGVIQRINPSVKIIAVSGHGADSSGLPPASQFMHAFLVKPFRPEVLLATVHELLRTPPNPPP